MAMHNKRFTLADLQQECRVTAGSHRLAGRELGLVIEVPAELQAQYPYNAPVYTLMQQLRQAIFTYGWIVFPGLQFNLCNYTLAQRAPQQHRYSSNPYLTDYCQLPHQDTPPYPTAFGLLQERRFFATWLLTEDAVAHFMALRQQQPGASIDALHRQAVAATLKAQTAILVNQQPGLILIDNSNRQSLYHARTCNFAAIDGQPDVNEDTPMYAFNEIGLLHYIDQLDSQRGMAYRDAGHAQAVQAFMAQERLA